MARHYCRDCNQHFQNENNLTTHLNSSIHCPRDIDCLFRCGKSFVRHSALILHLEAGGCSSGMDRESVNNFIRQHNRSHRNTDASRTITSGSSSDEDITYTTATRASWNGSGFECNLCNNVYPNLNRLNQHLSSPIHQPKIYICPAHRSSGRFSTLSGLYQHVESKACSDPQLRPVQATMDMLLGDMGRLTL
jgi:hypothetical protein